MSTSHLGRVAAALAAMLIGTAGCAFGSVGSNPLDDPPGPADAPRGKLGQGGDAPSREEADKAVRVALKDVERYWTATFPTVAGGAAFQPVRGGFHPYTRSDPPPPCGRERPRYQPNAFYCPAGDFIAWDAEQLIPQLNDDFGPPLVAVVMAHEYGHAVQARLSLGEQPTIVLEQQADCFAGSWLADVNAGNAQGIDKVRPDQLDNTVAGMLMLRDQPGTSALSPQAHGNAFDRVRAFQEGYEQGATRCAAYRRNNLPVTEIPFSTEEEAASGGDLPYDQAVTELSEDAQAYWSRAFPQLAPGQDWKPLRVEAFDPARPPECADRPLSADDAVGAAFYCEAGDFAAFDGRTLGPALHQRIGDNAVGMLLADLFAQAAQERRGQSSDGKPGQLAVDCLAGSWAYDLLNNPAQGRIRLSPGDLDEAVAALLVFGRSGKSTDASAFDRIGAFRGGVLEGLGRCT